VKRALVLLITAGIVQACSTTPGDCATRYGTPTFQGSEQYVGTLGGATGIFGSMPRQATVDWDPYVRRTDGDGSTCSTYGVTLVLTLSPRCTLAATLISAMFDTGRGASGAFLSAAASINGGQACTVPVSGGEALVAIDSGSMSWDDAATMKVVLSGRITEWLGTAPSSGYLTYTFDGTFR
jgi:hypothetical protein